MVGLAYVTGIGGHHSHPGKGEGTVQAAAPEIKHLNSPPAKAALTESHWIWQDWPCAVSRD